MGWQTAAFGLSGYNHEKAKKGGGMTGDGGILPETKRFYEYFPAGTDQNPGWYGITSPIMAKETTKSNVPVYPQGAPQQQGGSGLARMLGSVGGAMVGQALIPVPGLGAAVGASLGGELGGMAEGAKFDPMRAGMNVGLGMLTGGMGSGSSAAAAGSGTGAAAAAGAASAAPKTIPPPTNAAGGAAATGGIKGALMGTFKGGNSGIYTPDQIESMKGGGYMSGVKKRIGGMWDGRGGMEQNWGNMLSYGYPSMMDSYSLYAQ